MAMAEAGAAHESGKEQMLPVTRKGMSRRCKCCIGCAVATGVVLAVAVPVGICVVGPAIAQQAIDWSTLHIHHSNIYDVPDSGVNGTQWNKITVHSPAIFPAQIQEQIITLVADQPDPSPFGFTNGPFGNFTMPKIDVKKGDNEIDWTTPILFNHSADMGFRFVFWTYMVAQGSVARINLTSEPIVKSFGLSFKTKMVKPMVCNCLQGSGCIPEKPKFNDSALTLESFAGVGSIAPLYLFCEPVGTDVSNGTQWNNTGFMMGAAMRLSALANRFLA
jgi:hypothetical protein